MVQKKQDDSTAPAGFSIGGLKLVNPVVAAPLAGITHLPHRLLAKAAGCGLVCSEMVSANGLVQQSAKTRELLRSDPAEKPLSVQIFGARPDILAAAAQIVEEYGADVIDINFGCSVKKVLKGGAGAALMREPAAAEKILMAVRRAVRIPLTIKIRSGWDSSGVQALETAQIAEACGMDAVAVHPRTARQGFAGKADWALIAAVKKAVSLPVIGNGDVVSPATAAAMMVETGCDAVMIGRAAIGNPWIFAQVRAHLADEPLPAVDLALRRRTIVLYMRELVEQFGEKRGCRMMRSQLGWFVKGLPFSGRFRESIRQVSSLEEATGRINAYWSSIEILEEGRPGAG